MDFKNISRQVVNVHEQLRLEWPHLKHIAIGFYEAETDELHLFANPDGSDSTFVEYKRPLSLFPAVEVTAKNKTPEIIDGLSLFSDIDDPSGHIINSYFRSSFTVPMSQQNGQLLGFMFFDASEKEFFTKPIRDHLTVYTRLIASMVMSNILPLKVLHAAVVMTQKMARFKDEETASHIARVAHYSCMIAESLAQVHNLSDEFINFVLLYSPLHDIGKIGIPDHILLKPGRLDPDEYSIMQTHVDKGVEIVELLLSSFDFGDYNHPQILRNIAGYHHERFDGSGYPNNLIGSKIPIESRIVAVADVFDAMSNPRPYHKGRSIEETFNYLESESGKLFDQECVNALLARKEEVYEIRKVFVPETYPR
jgi:HD-GYP domain-containing protein (c-di-GMP phosphodiesterase class II)